MVDVTKYMVTAGNIGLVIVVILLILVLFGLLGWWLYRLINYNKRTVVRTIEGNNVLIQVDWSKEYKDKKDGAYYWRLKKRKHRLPRPPASAIDITSKGKEWVELYYIGQGQYVPCKTTKPDFSQKETFIESFQPITASQRATYADQYQKSLGYKTKGIMDLLPLIIPGVTLIMMLVVFMLFFGDVTKPIASMAESVSGMSKTVSENIASFETAQLGILRELKRKGVTVGEIPNGTISPPD